MRIVQIILAFGAKTKLLNFFEKMKIASGKYVVNMVTWLHLPFAENVVLNLFMKCEINVNKRTPILLLGIPAQFSFTVFCYQYSLSVFFGP